MFSSRTGLSSLLFIRIKAGSVGLNLTCCSRVILMDLWVRPSLSPLTEHHTHTPLCTQWNPAIEAQAFDRAHRMGQKEDVKIYKITVTNTIEDRYVAFSHFTSTILTRTSPYQNPDPPGAEGGARQGVPRRRHRQGRRQAHHEGHALPLPLRRRRVLDPLDALPSLDPPFSPLLFHRVRHLAAHSPHLDLYYSYYLALFNAFRTNDWRSEKICRLIRLHARAFAQRLRSTWPSAARMRASSGLPITSRQL